MRAVEEIRTWAGRHGIEVVCNLDYAQPSGASQGGAFGAVSETELRDRFEGADLTVTLGGDGTLLYAVRIVAPLQTPVLSINLGSLGFHTQAELPELPGCLDAVRDGHYRVEKRLLLEVTVENPDHQCPPDQGAASPPSHVSNQFAPGPAGPIYALNDVVVSKSAWGHMVHLRLHADGKPLSDVDADSLVVATPTGSSAYNFAANGPVIVPWMEAIVLNAICPHRMNLAPLVLSPDSTLQVRAYRRSPLEEAQILIDGQAWHTLSPAGCLKISRAPLYLPLVTLHDNFYEKLRNRLRWGGLN